MVGAIIGDLAAWTWEHDKNAFYKRLILPEAVHSSKLKDMFLTTDLLMRQKDMDLDNYRTYFGESDPVETLIRTIAIGWLYDSEQETRDAFQKYSLFDYKEDWYAGRLLCLHIFNLRHGASKKEAALANQLQYMVEYFKDKETALGIVSRAWKAFESAFDFGSAIHNAMKLPGDRHVNGILVGALADAMYGCERYMVKSKYGESCFLHCNVPVNIEELHHFKRIFFPKNNADTNVQKHEWYNIPNPFKNDIITPEMHRRILKAFQPSFDFRYGFYLDDGFVYVYRSGRVLQRFKLNRQNDGTYRISHLQSTKSAPTLYDPINEALYAVEFRWNMVCDEDEFHQGH